jgi:O-antigen/teichoic acid export membrane protein
MQTSRVSSGLRDVAITFGSQIASLALGLATQSALAWWLGTSGRGSYAACVVFITVLNVLFVVGFDVAIEVFVASRRFTVSEGVTYTFLCGALSSLIAVAAGLVALQWPFALLDKATPRQFLMALAWMPIGMVASILSRFPAALGKFALAGFVQVGQIALQLGLTLALVLGMGAGVEGAIAAGVISSVTVMAVVPLLLRREDDWRWVRPSLARLRETWSFGLRYYVGKVSNLATIEFGTVVVAMFVGKEEIGLFAVAAAVTARAEFIPNVIGTVILPRVAASEEGRPELVAQCARLTAATCAVFLGILVLFTEIFVRVLFSPAFLPAVPLIRIIALGTLVRCAAKVVVPYLISRNRPGLASTAVFSGMVVNIAVMLALLGRIGLPAAAIGVTVSHLVSSVILLAAFQRVSGMSFGRFWAFSRGDWEPVVRAFGRFPAPGL